MAFYMCLRRSKMRLLRRDEELCLNYKILNKKIDRFPLDMSFWDDFVHLCPKSGLAKVRQRVVLSLRTLSAEHSIQLTTVRRG
jgi:hypothetical protein